MNSQNGKGNSQLTLYQRLISIRRKKIPFVFNYGRYYIKMA